MTVIICLLQTIKCLPKFIYLFFFAQLQSTTALTNLNWLTNFLRYNWLLKWFTLPWIRRIVAVSFDNVANRVFLCLIMYLNHLWVCKIFIFYGFKKFKTNVCDDLTFASKYLRFYLVFYLLEAILIVTALLGQGRQVKVILTTPAPCPNCYYWLLPAGSRFPISVQSKSRENYDTSKMLSRGNQNI